MPSLIVNFCSQNEVALFMLCQTYRSKNAMSDDSENKIKVKSHSNLQHQSLDDLRGTVSILELQLCHNENLKCPYFHQIFKRVLLSLREKMSKGIYSMVLDRHNEKKKTSNVTNIRQTNNEFLYPSRLAEFFH